MYVGQGKAGVNSAEAWEPLEHVVGVIQKLFLGRQRGKVFISFKAAPKTFLVKAPLVKALLLEPDGNL